jgi:hypothetical protein
VLNEFYRVAFRKKIYRSLDELQTTPVQRAPRAFGAFDQIFGAFRQDGCLVRPDYAEAPSNRGVTLDEPKRFDAALASYDRAPAVRPDYAEAFCNRGVTLHELTRLGRRW